MWVETKYVDAQWLMGLFDVAIVRLPHTLKTTRLYYYYGQSTCPHSADSVSYEAYFRTYGQFSFLSSLFPLSLPCVRLLWVRSIRCSDRNRIFAMINNNNGEWEKLRATADYTMNFSLYFQLHQCHFVVACDFSASVWSRDSTNLVHNKFLFYSVTSINLWNHDRK